MEKEPNLDLTRRISQSNRSGLTVINYEIIFAYLDDAKKAYQEEIGIRCRAQIDDFTDFIFVNRFGNVQHHGTLNKALKRIIRDCNCKEVTTLPNFSNHSLRHTFTTRMCEAGVNIKAMQDILGHADVETTLGIYADATKELKAKEMSGFDEYFKELTAGKDA